MKRLENKVALITGASRGIGKAIALAFGREGAKTVVCYNASASEAQEVKEEIDSFGAESIVLQTDISSRSSVKEALKIIDNSFGSVEILVNNAAIAQEKKFGAISDDDWDRMMTVNLRGPFCCTQEVISMMVKKGWGRIINIVSIGGQWGGFNQVHYAASKAGLINFTRSVAKIYSKDGITSNAVSPGLVKTEMSQNELNSDAGKEKVMGIPAGRISTVEEIANVVAFLASDAASYITGQTINVNGGMYFG